MRQLDPDIALSRSVTITVLKVENQNLGKMQISQRPLVQARPTGTGSWYTGEAITGATALNWSLGRRKPRNKLELTNDGE